MPESPQPAQGKNNGSFASFLASFAGAADKPNDDWDLRDLAEDVATISYEDAMRAYRPPRSSRFATRELPEAAPSSIPAPATSTRGSVPEKKKRKTASLTLRLSENEQAQLHERAAAAQMSVSAYTRSCIFEAESLRTQVKEALSQIRSSAGALTPSSNRQRATTGPKLFQLFSHWSRRKENREPTTRT